MQRVSNRRFGPAMAILMGGPTFVSSYSAAALYAKLPHAIAIEPDLGSATSVAGLVVMVTLVGAIVALLPVMLGTLVLSDLGISHAAWRSPLAWTATGAGVGALPAVPLALSGSAPELVFALVATSALCARLARVGLRWTDPAHPPRSVRTPAVTISNCPPK